MRCTLEKIEDGIGYVVKVFAVDGFILHEKSFNVEYGDNYAAAKKYQAKIRAGKVKIPPRLVPVRGIQTSDSKKRKSKKSAE